MRIALLYEHPSWSTGLIERALERGIDLTPIDVSGCDLSAVDHRFDLWVNRVNAMPSGGRPSSIVAATAHLLTALELRGERILNGARSHRIGGSKAAQAAMFTALGLGTPSTAAIHRPDDAPAAADRVGYPVLTKPNIGGSGTGIHRYDSVEELAGAVESGSIDLGIDGTGVVQRVIESADGFIHRVEMLGDAFFYGTRQRLRADAFNYCAADGCAIEPGGDAIELFHPSAEIVGDVAGIMRAAETDVGGVEYIVDASTGKPSFYDFNPYSNFVTGFDIQLGFDPVDRYLDFVQSSHPSPRPVR